MLSIPWENVSSPPALDPLPIAPSPRNRPGRREDSFGEHLRRVGDDRQGPAAPAENNPPPPQEPASSDEEAKAASAASAPDAESSPPPAEQQDLSSEDKIDGEDGEPKPQEDDTSSPAGELAAATAMSQQAESIPSVETAEREATAETGDTHPSVDVQAKQDPGGSPLDAADPAEAPAGRGALGAEGENEARSGGPAAPEAESAAAHADEAGGEKQSGARGAAGQPGDGPESTDSAAESSDSRDASPEARSADGSVKPADEAALGAAANPAAEETSAASEGGEHGLRAERAAPLKDSDGAPSTPRAEARSEVATLPDSTGPRPPQQAIADSVDGGAKARTISRAQQTRFFQRVAKAFSAARDRGGELSLRLSPPELGSLHLQIKVQHGVLTARLETETSLARTMLLDNLPLLRERLAEQGVRVEQFDVNLAGRQFGGSPQDGMRNPDHGRPSPAPAGDRDAAGDGRDRTGDGAASRRVVDEGRLNVIV